MAGTCMCSRWSQAPSSIGTGRFGGNFVKSSWPAATPETANIAVAPSQDRRVIYLSIRPPDPLGNGFHRRCKGKVITDHQCHRQLLDDAVVRNDLTNHGW